MPNESGFSSLVGKPVKLVVQEPGQEIHTIYGKLLNIENGFILFKSQYGIGSFNLRYVIAIKHMKSKWGRN